MPALLIIPLICASLAQPQVRFQDAPNRIRVSIDGEPFSNFHFGPDWPQPFLHPLRAASGVAVTRGYPVEKLEGESQDHNWHHGLWWAHGDINGVDFWRDKGPAASGRMVLKSPPRFTGDTLSGRFDLITPKQDTIGSVELVFRFAARGGRRLVDARVILHADRGVALKLGDTEEGSFALRLRDEFREDRGAVLSNSDGLVGTSNIWGKRAKWVDYSAVVVGEKLGVTVLDHPANPRYPTYWHARGYGLCAANPFGEHDFLRDKTRDGSLTVPAGSSATFRYRVVIHAGAVDPAEAARWAAEFAKEEK